MAFPTAQQIMAAAPKSGLQQLGELLQAGTQGYLQGQQIGQARDDRQAQQQAAKAKAQKEAQAADLFRRAVASDNPQEQEQLVAQASLLAPDFIDKALGARKTMSDIESKGGTRFQAVPFETGFRVFDRKTGQFTGDLVEDEAAAKKAAAEQEAKTGAPAAGAKEGEKKAAGFATRMSEAMIELNELEDKIDPTSRIIPMIAGGGSVTGEIANRFASPEEQRYASASSDFVTAVLRDESGAVISEEEFERKYKELFPVPGDSAAQIKQKRERRKTQLEGMKVKSGGLYERLQSNKAGTPLTAQDNQEVVDWSSL